MAVFGWLAATGEGFEQDFFTRGRAIDLGVSAFSSVDLTPWLFLRLELGALFPLIRDRFFFTDTATGEEQTIFRQSVASGLVSLSLGFTFL